MEQEAAKAVTEAPGGRTRGDPVITLALNNARALLRAAIKAKNLNEEDWPASRITQAAKALLDSSAGDRIIAVAREQIRQKGGSR